MDLPIIDLSSLPDLQTLTGVFGSLLDTARGQGSDDRIIALMTWLYDVAPPQEQQSMF